MTVRAEGDLGGTQHAALGRSQGYFLAVVGPDGVGKTTVARALIERFDGPTAYVHFRPSLLGSLASHPGTGSKPPPPWGKTDPGSWDVLAGWARLVRSVAIFWFRYFVTIRPALRRGTLVVADRWGYGYWVQPRALKFYGPRWLAALAIKILPRPDLVAVLSTDPERVRQRKRELSLRAIVEEQKAWREFELQPAEFFDAARSPEEVASAIERRLGS